MKVGAIRLPAPEIAGNAEGVGSHEPLASNQRPFISCQAIELPNGFLEFPSRPVCGIVIFSLVKAFTHVDPSQPPIQAHFGHTTATTLPFSISQH